MEALFSTLGKGLSQKLPMIIIVSMSFVAGLAWNDAFTTLINHYYPTGTTSASYSFKFLYAFVLTLVIIGIMVVISIVTGAPVA